MTVLALILNLGGGPMAWAHLSGSGGHVSASGPELQMPANCEMHTHANRDDPAPAQPHPCCAAGSCECATPPAPPAFTFVAPAGLRHESPPSFAVDLVAPDPLDDSLRPPIR
jgi:hypothetical protein